jgi:hypothetical protein
LSLTSKDASQRGLAGAIASDESNLVTIGDAQGHIAHQDARSSPDFEPCCAEHRTSER